MPVDVFTDITANKRRGKGTQIDSDVEDGKAGIAPRIMLAVKLPHHGAYVRLEQARSGNNQHQAQKKRHHAGKRHAEMTQRDDDATRQHSAARAEDLICNPTAGQREQINHACVEAVNSACLRRGKTQSVARNRRGHKQNQQRAHAVVAEPLPQLG